MAMATSQKPIGAPPDPEPRGRRLFWRTVRAAPLLTLGFGIFCYFYPQVVQVQLKPSRGSSPEAGTLQRLSELEAKLRAIYHDCQVGERETAEVTELLAGDPNLAQVYPEFERTR